MKRHRNHPRQTAHHRHVVLVVLSVALAVIVTSSFLLWMASRDTASYIRQVGGIRFDRQGDQIFRPGNGRKYVVVEIEVKNVSGSALPFAPVIQTYVEDLAGVRYTMAPARLDTPFIAGILQPGEVRRGQLSYNVAESVSSLDFVFESGDTHGIVSRTHLR